MRKENGLTVALAGAVASVAAMLTVAVPASPAAGGGASAAAGGPELVLEALLAPERAVAVEIPEYYGETDRAEAQLAAGAYRTVVLALADAEQRPRVKRILAEANWRLGRLDEAAKCLEGMDVEASVVLAARIDL